MSYFQGYELGYGVGYQAGFKGQSAELVEREIIESLRRITLPEKFLTTFAAGWRDGYQKAFKKRQCG